MNAFKPVFPVSGDSIVLWKQGDRVISAGPIQVRKDYRFALVEAASLRISEVTVADTGKQQIGQYKLIFSWAHDCYDMPQFLLFLPIISFTFIITNLFN